MNAFSTKSVGRVGSVRSINRDHEIAISCAHFSSFISIIVPRQLHEQNLNDCCFATAAAVVVYTLLYYLDVDFDLLLCSFFKNLHLEPNSRSTFESRSECYLHNPVSFLQWVIPLMVMNIFKLIPD